MPKWGAGEVYEQNLPADLGSEGAPRQGGSLTKGQILWLRGITRLQTQVSFLPLMFDILILASMIKKTLTKTTHDVHKSRVGLCTIDDILLIQRIMSLKTLELRRMYA